MVERVADERTEEAEDAEGLGRRSGMANTSAARVEDMDDGLGRGPDTANTSARVDGGGRGVASSTSGPPRLVLGVGILGRRSGVCCA